MGDVEADPDLAALRRLVGDVDAFAERHWGQRPLHRRSGDDFADLLTVERIEALLLSGARRPTFRLVREGTTLTPERSTTSVRLGGRAVDDVADVARIATELAAGATLVMQGLQRTDIAVAQLCRSLERAISHPVQANAYLSPPEAAGLAEHADDHDVLVLQVVGTKHWEIQHLGAVTTEPGDVMYLPAGVRHAASTEAATSLHLTIGIVPVTRGDALRRLLAADAGAAMRRPLPLGYARPDRVEALADALLDSITSAGKALTEVDLARAVEAERRRAARRRRPFASGQLRSVLALSSLDIGSTVRRRLDALAELTDGPGDQVTLALVDRRLRLPGAMRAALDVLLTGAPTAIGDLPGLDAGDQLVLVRRLVREGLLVVDRTSEQS